jgi:hypothetical protein
MANEVYANGREVACKAGSGKSICCFPDVCFTPPQTPATPPGVPIPYPNTGMASDTTDGSKTVQISGKEVMLKNKSYFKKSIGDEAGCAPKKGVVTSTNRGKVYFNAWSMDVKFEGENVVRHLDLTTHNHNPYPGNTPTWPYCDALATGEPGKGCKKERNAVKANCSGKNEKEQCKDPGCKAARKCMLAAYKPPKRGKHGLPKTAKCCPGETGHHAIPVQEFSIPGKPRGRPLNDSVKSYSEKLAPCVCAEGEDHKDYKNTPPYQLKEHGRLGNAFNQARETAIGSKDNYCYSEINEAAALSVTEIFPQCTAACIKTQLDNYHVKQAKIPADKPVMRKSEQHSYPVYKPKPSKVRSK